MNPDENFEGYLANKFTRSAFYKKLCQNRNEALIVSSAHLSAGEAFEFQIETGNPRGKGKKRDSLAVCWPDGYSVKSNDSDAICCSWSGVTSEDMGWRERKVWKISSNGELGVEYPRPDCGTEILRPYYSRYMGDLFWLKSSKSMVSDFDVSCVPVTIKFEDMMSFVLPSPQFERL